jgi:hypothetical protein
MDKDSDLNPAEYVGNSEEVSSSIAYSQDESAIQDNDPSIGQISQHDYSSMLDPLNYYGQVQPTRSEPDLYQYTYTSDENLDPSANVTQNQRVNPSQNPATLRSQPNILRPSHQGHNRTRAPQVSSSRGGRVTRPYLQPPTKPLASSQVAGSNVATTGVAPLPNDQQSEGVAQAHTASQGTTLSPRLFIDSLSGIVDLERQFNIPQPHALKLYWGPVSEEIKALAVHIGIHVHTGPDIPHAILPTDLRHVANDEINWNIKFLRQVVGFEICEIADLLTSLNKFKASESKDITEANVHSRWSRNAKLVGDIQQDKQFNKEICKKAVAKKRKAATEEKRQNKKRKTSHNDDDEEDEGSISLVNPQSTFNADDDIALCELYLNRRRELYHLLTEDINNSRSKMFTVEQVLDRIKQLDPK